MSLFLSEEKQWLTDSVFSVGLGNDFNDEKFDIITALYSIDSVEYYLFNKLRIWKS